jgi:hypothetical protein
MTPQISVHNHAAATPTEEFFSGVPEQDAAELHLLVSYVVALYRDLLNHATLAQAE